MDSARRRRGLAALVLALVGSPVWAAGSVPAHPDEELITDVAPPEVLAAIQAGRPAGYPIGGIDISSHDHRRFPVHWGTEAAAGSRFVYVKATEGTTYVNPHFATDYAAARAARRYVGAYAFARTDRCYNLTPAQMRAWIRAFVDRVEADIGRRPMIYTNAYWWDPCTGGDPSFGGYPLDVANYSRKPPTLPAGWTTFALWQYVPGDPDKRGAHDRDVVNGGLAGLQALAWPPPPEPAR